MRAEPDHDCTLQGEIIGCLHLQHIAMVDVDTRMIPRVLSEAAWRRMGREDLQALTRLLHDQVNSYGIFELDREKRFPLGGGPVSYPPDGTFWRFRYRWAELASPCIMVDYRTDSAPRDQRGVVNKRVTRERSSHPDPQSCVGGREAGGKALTGEHVSQPSNCEIRSSRVPTLLSEAEGHNEVGVRASR